MSAKCLSGYEWLFSPTNSSQSPCDVATELGGICSGGQFTLAPLDSGTVYVGPSGTNANSCRCSSVYYTLMSACAYCQSRNYIRWSQYAANCSTIYLQSFAEAIPESVGVPLWAYQNVSIGDTFNVTLARINATNTSGSTTSRVVTRVTLTTNTSSRTAQSSATSGSVTDSTNSSINVAAIAGGLVGGFIAFCLIVGVWLSCRSRNHNRIEAQDVLTPYSSVSRNPMPPSDGSRLFPAKNTGHSGSDTTIAVFSTGRSKAQLVTTHDGGILPTSDSGSRSGGTPGAEDSSPPVVSRLRPRHSQGPEVQLLRREVEQLRTEMHEIRAGQQLLQHQPRMTEEPPPLYFAES